VPRLLPLNTLTAGSTHSEQHTAATHCNTLPHTTHKGGASVEAAGLEESEDHATADDDLIALAHE